MMRILLFLATNMAVLIIASITLKLLGVDRFTGQVSRLLQPIRPHAGHGHGMELLQVLDRRATDRAEPTRNQHP